MITEVFLHKKEMPKSCIDCIFLPEYYCLLTSDLILTATNKEDIKNKRYSTCPLRILNESGATLKAKKGDTARKPRNLQREQLEIRL